jgi:diguanylate cyclase (GGDEF)-like protein
VSWFTTYVYPFTFVPAVALCFMRARVCTTERFPWSLVAWGYIFWAAAQLGYNLSVASGVQPPVPSLADLGWLVYYPLVFTGLLGVVRSRTDSNDRAAWLDGLIGALALGALAAAFLVGPITAAVGGDLEATATLIAYPLGDVALTLIVLTVGAQLGWRPGRDWLFIAAGLALQVGADIVFSYKSAQGTWHFGGLVDVIWPLASLLIAWAAWHRTSVTPRAHSDRWQTLVVPTSFATVALALLVLESLGPFPRFGAAPVMLAAAAIVASLVRAATTFREKQVLSDLALRDPLTGLIHHGAFHNELATEVSRRQGSTDPFSVVLFDLDGFKEINDLRGHAEGDRVLREVAEAMRDAPREDDVVGRVGGDEFALLLRGADGPAATAVAERVRRSLRERGTGVDASFGVGTWPQDGPYKNLLLLRADTALYAVKSDGEAVRANDPDDSGAVRRRGESEVERSKRDLERAQLRAYAEDVRSSYARELYRTQELKESYLATVKTLAAAVEAKDEYTGGHIQRVHAIGLLLAKEVNPGSATDAELSYGFLLHDVGKLAVPDAVLNKPGKLTAEEWGLMKLHPEQGAAILSAVPFLGTALEVVRHHHERWDGSGYPDGLQGEEIPLWARLFAVVDTVDAITSDRPYRAAQSLDVAIAELRKGAGSQFDPACVEAFARVDRAETETLLQRRADQLPKLNQIGVPEFSVKVSE